LFFASVGAYAAAGEVLDLLLLFAIGLLGFAMRRYGLPVLPAIVGVILGPAAELQMRRALQISDGSLTGLINSPIAVVIYVVIAVLLAWPLLRRLLPRRAADAEPKERVDA
ncbi:tripartite tricarboxylate transporter permease, partial [Saccharomonospora sp. NPDC046836]